jgi:hypothetical protein
MLEGWPQFVYDGKINALDKMARKNNFKGAWLLVKLGCLNYERARILMDGWELDLVF